MVQITYHCKSNGCEGLVDLEAFDVADGPVGPFTSRDRIRPVVEAALPIKPTFGKGSKSDGGNPALAGFRSREPDRPGGLVRPYYNVGKSSYPTIMT